MTAEEMGATIERLRKAKGLSLVELAARSGLSPDKIRYMERALFTMDAGHSSLGRSVWTARYKQLVALLKRLDDPAPVTPVDGRWLYAYYEGGWSWKQLAAVTELARSRVQNLAYGTHSEDSPTYAEAERLARERMAAWGDAPPPAWSRPRLVKGERPTPEQRAAAAEEIDRHHRPQVRADCKDGARPCPWAGCRYHLGYDVTHGGSLKDQFPGREVIPLEGERGLPVTCALDVADKGEHTLAEVAEALNLTRERVRQIEKQALDKLADRLTELGLDAHEWLGVCAA